MSDRSCTSSTGTVSLVYACGSEAWREVCGIMRRRVESMLWPTRGIKCVLSDDGLHAEMVTCGASLLTLLPGGSPQASAMLHIINSHLQQYQKQYRCGCNTLVLMLSYWSEAVIDKLLLHNLNRTFIREEMRECLEQLIQTLNRSSRVIGVDTVVNELYVDEGGGTGKVAGAISQYSRHMVDDALTPRHILVNHRHLIYKCVQYLSHLDDSDGLLMQLLADVWYNQLATRCTADGVHLAVHHVHVHPMPSRDQRLSKVIPGFVTQCANDNMAHISVTAKYNAVILNGSLSRTFTHLGHKESIRVSSRAEGDEPKNVFVNSVLEIVRDLQITCILARGGVDSDVKEVLLAQCGCVVITHVHSDLLHSVATSAQVRMCTYMWECMGEHIVHDVHLEIYSDNMITVLLHSCHLQSILLCHPSTPVVDLLHQRLVHALYRLHHATLCNDECTPSCTLVRGRGEVESQCVKILEERISSTDDADRKLVLETLSEGFRRFVHRLHHSMDITDVASTSQNAITVYDAYAGKVTGWRLCIRIISILLQHGQHIVTGVTHRVPGSNGEPAATRHLL